jgi:predicted permease
MNWRRYFRRSRADAELLQEIELHMAEEVDENIARGMAPNEARRRAYLKFGNPQQIRENLWQQNTPAVIEGIWRDLKCAARALARSPGFALVAILVMGLGIGANVTLFTVVRSVLLKPLPYRDPGQLFTIYEHERVSQNFAYMPVDAGSFAEWQKSAQGAAQMALVSPWQQYNVSANGGKLPEKIDAGWCSWNFFETLGVTPALGRLFRADDDRPDAEATVVLSAPFWTRRYDADPQIVGKRIWLDAKSYTVIGVLPSSFAYSGAFSGNSAQVWTPASHEAPAWLMRTFEDHEFVVIARLAPGITLAGFTGQLSTVQTQIKADHPALAVHDMVIGRTMLDDAVHVYKTSLYALLAATGCVLLIACLNVASLLVARTAARSRELAIRGALGAGRLRLMRERLVESTLLSMAGGAAGLLLAWWALEWLVRTRRDMNRVEAIHIDGAVVIFMLAAVLVCALFSGLISALSWEDKQILVALQESSRTHSAGHARAGLRKILLVVEVGLTAVLLIGAGSLLKSYQRLRSTDLGVPPDNVLTIFFSLPEARYKEPVQRIAFFERVIERVRSLPGVQGAGLVSAAPGQGWGGDHQVSVVEHPPMPNDQGIDLMSRGAEPGYFAAIQIPLVHGRIFRQSERLEHANVVILDQSAAKVCFPGSEDPGGKHLHDDVTQQTYEVVGVVGDTRWAIAQPVHPTMYRPLYGNDYSVATITVRSNRDVEKLALPVQKIIGELDPDLPVSDVMTLRETIAHSTIDSQFDSLLVLAFAIIALLLAAAGLYGVLAYMVTQRTSEIGIRIAVGAQRSEVMRRMLLDGLLPAWAGLALGLLGGVFAVQLIRGMLYGADGLDWAVFAQVTVVLSLVAALACVVPAWRASRLDPMQALRTE